MKISKEKLPQLLSIYSSIIQVRDKFLSSQEMQRWGLTFRSDGVGCHVCKSEAEVAGAIHFNANPCLSGLGLLSSTACLGLTSRESSRQGEYH